MLRLLLYIKNVLLFTLALCSTCSVYAQACDSNYFSLTYKLRAYHNYKKSVTTAQNETVSIGDLVYPRGWMNKLNAQGTPVWSNEYLAGYYDNNFTYFSNLTMKDIAPGANGTFIVSGSISRDGEFTPAGYYPPRATCALMMNIDKSGNVLWGRRFMSKFLAPHSFDAVTVLRNGNIAAYMQLMRPNYKRYSKVVCMSPEGDVLWDSDFFEDEYSIAGDDSTRRCITEASNGNIIVGDVLAKYVEAEDRNVDSATEAYFHFYAVDQSNGALLWETSYGIPPESGFGGPSIVQITPLPNGNLSVLTTLPVSASGSPPFTPKTLNIILNDSGKVQRKIAYSLADGSPCRLVAAHYNAAADVQTMLLKDTNDKAVLAAINSNGQLIWSQGYGKAGDGLPPASFSAGSKGYTIFFSDPFVVYTLFSNAIVTDPAGNIDCATTSVILTAEDANWLGRNLVVASHTEDFGGYQVFPITVTPGNYPLAQTINCQKDIPCCVDKVDTVNIKDIYMCSGETYTLPDSTVVQGSGRYDITLTTSKGCDSTIFYRVKTFKRPSELDGIRDTCLADNDSLVLTATPGYETYNWTGITSTTPDYKVYAEGAYKLNVSNYCGSKTDTFEVYKQCAFPLYIPSAFTPNGDGINDVFRVPPQNKNRLVRLTVYNRWGRMVFTTTNKSEGWNGYVGSQPQDNGVYIYYLQMVGLTGISVSIKGTVVLMR